MVTIEDRAQEGVDLVRPVTEGRAVAAVLELVVLPGRGEGGDLAHALGEVWTSWLNAIACRGTVHVGSRRLES